MPNTGYFTITLFTDLSTSNELLSTKKDSITTISIITSNILFSHIETLRTSR